ncbi:MAG TPA: hypothetical protein VLL75_20200 [Vicinamibacteria bacterium]|nr:hypothetical protein [Vicinamibacteria bacterium]
MSTRWSRVVVVLASMVGSAAAEGPESIPVEDGREPVAVEGVFAPRRLAPEPPPAEPLAARILWIDPTRAAVGLEAVARDETRSLLQKMDVPVTWRVGEPGEVARPGEVRVILLDRAAARESGEPILGATPPRFDGAPYLWIHVPNVRAAMGLRPDGPLATVEASSVRALGVALGRVVAHELVHALAPSAPHGKGLMSEKLTRFQLTANRLAVDPEVGLALRAALRGEPSLPPAGTAVLAATTTGRKREP